MTNPTPTPQSIPESRVLDAFCDYVKSNWNASLGYGADREVYLVAADNFGWLLDALGMTVEDFVNYCEEKL